MRKFSLLIQKITILSLMIFFMSTSLITADQDWEEGAADFVARITVIEGRLERYDHESQSWGAMVQDAPVGIDDRIFTTAASRVEILVPNNTVMRIGGDTGIQFVSLTATLTEIDLLSGTARLNNNSTHTDMIAMTPFGYAEVPPGASADLYVDDEGAEIIALHERVYFTHKASSKRHEVIAGSASLLASWDRIMPAGGYADNSWDRWNRDRDSLWAERRRSSGDSDHYLPTRLHDEAYVLNTWGTWQRVYYEGAYYRFWRPRRVGIGWSPFTNGRWMSWRGDRVWIPWEPFGYVTHHYGNWIYTHNCWYWAPPVTRVMVRTGLPLLNIGFNWYPGRVAWMEAGLQVSWIPLAPYENYYCRNPWGSRTIVITKGSYPRYTSFYRFKYRGHAVRVHRDHAYRYRNDSDSTTRGTGSRYAVRSSLVEKETDRAESGSRYAVRSSQVERRTDSGETGSRYTVRSSLVEDKTGRAESGSLRTTRTQEAGSQISEERKSTENRARERLNSASAANKSNVSGRESVQSRIRAGSTFINSDRISNTRTSSATVSENTRTSRQTTNQTSQRSSSMVTRQSRTDGTAGTVQRSGVQRSTGSSRSSNVTRRSDGRTLRNR